MLLLSSIVTNLQWNEQYIYAIFSGNFGFPNTNTVTCYIANLPNSPTCLQTLHCTHLLHEQKPIQVFARTHENFLTNFGEIYRSYNKLYKIYANFRVV